MREIAILYICTGHYDVFWKDFYISYEKYFLPSSNKEYFVFTDSEKIYEEDQKKVHKIYQKSLGWPDNTLMRFHFFLKIEDELKKFDYIFFMNANCQCVDYVLEENFLPRKKGLLVVKHPGFYNRKPDEFAYDRNPESEAYIPFGYGKYYVCGGVNGGRTEAYLKMVRELKKRVDCDKRNDVIALWHDESQLNRYILENNDYEVREAEYCFPEGWEIPFSKRIIVRDKSKWINVNKIKNIKKSGLVARIAKKIKAIYLKVHK